MESISTEGDNLALFDSRILTTTAVLTYMGTNGEGSDGVGMMNE